MHKPSGRDRESCKQSTPGGGPAPAWSHTLKVEVSGAGTVAQAGVVLPRLLADRLGLSNDLAEVMAGDVLLRHPTVLIKQTVHDGRCGRLLAAAR